MSGVPLAMDRTVSSLMPMGSARARMRCSRAERAGPRDDDDDEADGGSGGRRDDTPPELGGAGAPPNCNGGEQEQGQQQEGVSQDDDEEDGSALHHAASCSARTHSECLIWQHVQALVPRMAQDAARVPTRACQTGRQHNKDTQTDSHQSSRGDGPGLQSCTAAVCEAERRATACCHTGSSACLEETDRQTSRQRLSTAPLEGTHLATDMACG